MGAGVIRPFYYKKLKAGELKLNSINSSHARLKAKKNTGWSAWNKNRADRHRNGLDAYIMILPQVIGLLLFSIYPILWVIRWAWYDYNGVVARFTGAENFIRVFTRDMNYWQSLLNTIVLTFGKLAVEIPLAIVIAVLLNGTLAGKNTFRTLYFMPNVISVSIVGLIFSFLFSSFEGIVNNLLMDFNLIAGPINWFGHKWTAMLVIAFASIWQNFGINMLFFLSGLQNIPRDLYESADIDGASRFQQFRKITIPMLAPVIQVVFMLAIIGSLKMTDLVLVLTNGQPAGSTEVVMTYIFKYFFRFGEGSMEIQVGYASAMGFVTAIIIAAITVIYLKSTKWMSKIY